MHHPVLVLKGPPLQQRILGRESAYESANVDVLVPRRHGRRARSCLRSAGRRFAPDNGLLWRLDWAVALERSRVVLERARRALRSRRGRIRRRSAG